MYIVWYGSENREFLVQTDNVAEVCSKAEKLGYKIKEVVRNER